MAEAEQPDHREQEIAVVALAGRFPGARDVEQLWENLRDGVESIRTFREEELLAAGVTPEELRHPDYVRAGGVLDGVELFDAAFFGYSPREAEVLDPQHRLFLECAWEALERAGYSTEACKGLIAVYAGVTASTYLLFHLLPDREVVRRAGRTALGLANDKDYLATRVSYKLDLKGPSFTVQTACSTSLVAVHLACQSLLNGECDMALAGGVSVPVPQETGYLYEKQGILSPDGHCRAFDAGARGTVGGRGAGVVVLKRLLDAVADGDVIHAVIKGSGINNDGSSKVGFTAPSVEGQAGVIAEALALANVDPETVTCVEAHGTGTELGDPIEVEALTRVFRARTSRRGFCALGSIKTNIGHLDAAAGVAGLIKAVLALKHEAIPPSLHFERPNPAIDFAQSPFFVNTALRPWRRGPVLRRAGVSSFGLGGTNAHVVLEEAPEPEPPSPPARRWQLLLLSARTETALETTTSNLAGYLCHHPGVELADVAFTTHVGRRAFEQRRVLVCREVGEAAAILADPRSRQVLTRSCRPGDRPVAFLFSGLGEQYEDMAGELYRDEPVFREIFDRCCEILRLHLGVDLREVVYPDGAGAAGTAGIAETGTDLRSWLAPAAVGEGASRLDRTLYAQPALFVLEYALARLWMSWGVMPQAMLGYSVGEYVASCLAGVLSLEDALRLIAGRARLIDGLPAGAMLAVALSETAVGAWMEQGLALAAVNGPELCVVAGPEERIAALEGRLQAAGLVSRRLRTTHAFHTPDLAPVAGELTRLASSLRLRAPEIPFLSNVTGTWITAQEATDPSYWARHLVRTVRFGDAAGELWQAPGRVMLEVGPGQSLVSLALQNRPGAGTAADGAAVPSLRSVHERVSDSAYLLNALGQLWLAGVKVDWAGFHEGEQRHRVELPTYPFERRRHWVDLTAASQSDEPAGRSAGKDPEIARWFFTPGWKPTPPPERQAEGAPAAWMLIGGPASGEGPNADLESALARRLAEEGRRVVVVRFGDRFERTGEGSFTLRAREAEDYRALLVALSVPSADTGPWAAVHLGNLTGTAPSEAGGPGLFDKVQTAGYYSLLFLVQAWARTGAGLRLAAVADGLFDVSGSDPLVPEKAPLAALCKVVPQEQPAIRCLCLDVRPPAAMSALGALAERVLAEVESAASEVFVACRGARRWVEAFEPVRLEAAEPARRRLRPDGVYLLLGGLGGIGLRVAELLARNAGARLVLSGRSPFPPREEWDAWLADHPADDQVSRRIVRLRRIEALGGEVRTVQADAGDEGEVRKAVAAAVEGFGALHGVFHCAGITRGPSLGPLAGLGIAESEIQFHAKVHGLYALERALAGIEVDFCYLFSSASAVLGGLGLAAYSAASLFLDTFAVHRNADGRGVWMTSDWDPWPGEDVAPEPGAASSSVAQYTMTPAESAEALRRVLLYGPAHTVVVTGDLEARADVWLRGAGRGEGEEKGGARHPRNLSTSYVAPRNETERILTELWQEYLGIQPVGVHDNFFQLGGHSLMGMRLRAALEQTFRVELPMAAILQSPTVAEIAVAVEIALIEMLSGSDDLEEAVR